MTGDTKSADEGHKDGKSQAPSYRSLRRRRTRAGDTDEGSGVWLISFTDVMALMLTFFVLLFAMSNPKEEHWENFTETMQYNFNKYFGQAHNRGMNEGTSVTRIDFSRALDLSYLQTIIDTMLAKEESLAGIVMIRQGSNLVISLPQDLLFAAGKAEVTVEGSRALYTVGEMLGRIKNRIEIVGHTDPRPVTATAATFPSNWDLSIARASSVAAILEQVGYTRPVVIRGQAAGRYADLPEGMSETERLDLARRVDIVVMEDDGTRVKLLDIGMP